MWLKENNNDKTDKLYWTKKYLRRRQILNKKSGNNKPNNYKLAIILAIIVFLLSLLIYYIDSYQRFNFIENSIETKAVIVGYNYTNNSESFTSYTSHDYRYFYYVDGHKVYSFDFLDNYRYYNCNQKKNKTGDTITIRYLINKPKNSKIVCN